jgi:hypothetical protein
MRNRSSDPYLRLADPTPDTAPAPDPALFVNDLQDASKKLFFLHILCLFLFEGTYTPFFKKKSH